MYVKAQKERLGNFRIGKFLLLQKLENRKNFDYSFQQLYASLIQLFLPLHALQTPR